MGSIGACVLLQYEISYYDKDGNLLEMWQETLSMIPRRQSAYQRGRHQGGESIYQVRAGTDLLGADGIVHASWSDFSALAEKRVKIRCQSRSIIRLAVKAVGDEKKLVYQSYLDNQWEYRQFLADHGVASDAIEAELMKIQIQIKADGKS